jgi:hypothetical protein
MNTTSLISLGVLVVLLVLYMMRRKARLSREE